MWHRQFHGAGHGAVSGASSRVNSLLGCGERGGFGKGSRGEKPRCQRSGTRCESPCAVAQDSAQAWQSEHPIAKPKIAELRGDLARAVVAFDTELPADYPWDWLYKWGEANLSLEGSEQIVSVLLEPYGDLVDGLVECLSIDETLYYRINGAMGADELRSAIERIYPWALALDFAEPANIARFWYVSEAKLEPRLGERFEEDGGEAGATFGYRA